MCTMDAYVIVPTLEAENAELRAALALAEEDTRVIAEVASEVEGRWKEAELRGKTQLMVGMCGRWSALEFALRMAFL